MDCQITASGSSATAAEKSSSTASNTVRSEATGQTAPEGSTGTSAASRLSTPSCPRSEEHTSELQSRGHLVCRLLLEKKKPYARAAVAEAHKPDGFRTR